MDKKEIMCDTYNKINQAIWTYKCARNQNLGLRDASVEKKLDAAMTAMRKQLDKVLKAK
jgi:hypothetical protein